MEKAIFDADNLFITQGMNGSYSHQGNLAIDFSKCSYLKAPFTGIVKRIYPNVNAVWLESKDKVLYADGTIDYMTVVTMHDNNVSNLREGQTISQGEIYYHPGVKGNVTGAHILMSVGKGKFISPGWFQNQYGKWCINNQYDISKALFLSNKVKILYGMYPWKISENNIVNQTKTLEQITNEVIDGLWGNGEERRNRLTQAGYNYETVQNNVNRVLGFNNTSSSQTHGNIKYTVKSGDTLSAIARKYNVNVQQLYLKNKQIIGNNPNLIYPGQILTID